VPTAVAVSSGAMGAPGWYLLQQPCSPQPAGSQAQQQQAPAGSVYCDFAYKAVRK
jgi:hypothetical protein